MLCLPNTHFCDNEQNKRINVIMTQPVAEMRDDKYSGIQLESGTCDALIIYTLYSQLLFGKVIIPETLKPDTLVKDYLDNQIRSQTFTGGILRIVPCYWKRVSSV